MCENILNKNPIFYNFVENCTNIRDLGSTLMFFLLKNLQSSPQIADK